MSASFWLSDTAFILFQVIPSIFIVVVIAAYVHAKP